MADAPTTDEEPPPAAPRVFISYAWEDGEYGPYRDWVERLAYTLARDGLEPRLDRWCMGPGQGFVAFMNAEVRHADRILVIGSPSYRAKVHAHEEMEDTTGSGWEAMLVGASAFRGHRNKVVVALGRGPREEALPDFLTTQRTFDLCGEHAQRAYGDLAGVLLSDVLEASPQDIAPEIEGKELRRLFDPPAGPSAVGDAEGDSPEETALTPLGEVPPPPGPLDRQPRWRQPRTWLASAAGLGFLVVAAVFVINEIVDKENPHVGPEPVPLQDLVWSPVAYSDDDPPGVRKLHRRLGAGSEMVLLPAPDRQWVSTERQARGYEDLQAMFLPFYSTTLPAGPAPSSVELASGVHAGVFVYVIGPPSSPNPLRSLLSNRLVGSADKPPFPAKARLLVLVFPFDRASHDAIAGSSLEELVELTGGDR